MNCNHQALCWCAAMIAFLVSGCGRSEIYTVPVTGVVTLDDQPMAETSVGFALVDGQAAYNARTDDNGRFVMKYSGGIKGLPPGEYRVSVRSNSDFSPYGFGVPPVLPGQTPTKEDWEKLREQIKRPSPIPRKYHDATTSELTASVEDGGDNDFTFALESK